MSDSFIWVHRHVPSIHPSVRDRYISVDVERGYAASALGVIGPAARAALPALITASMAKNTFCGARARAALIQIRQNLADVPVLPPADIRNLTNRLRSAEVKLALGSNIEASVESWVAAIGEDHSRRFEIVEALGHNHCEPNASIQLLRGLLKDPEPGIRGNVLNMVIMQRTFAQIAWRDVAQCTKDPDANVRANATYAMLFAFPSPAGAILPGTNATTQTKPLPRTPK